MCPDDGNKKECKNHVLSFEFIVMMSVRFCLKTLHWLKVSFKDICLTQLINIMNLPFGTRALLFSWIGDTQYRFFAEFVTHCTKWLAYWDTRVFLLHKFLGYFWLLWIPEYFKICTSMQWNAFELNCELRYFVRSGCTINM